MIMPFKCEKSGAEFSPEEGGQCCLCHRFLILGYLHQELFLKQKSPICIDCLNEIWQLPDDVLQYGIFPTTRQLEMLGS
jgi:hypothetical protein